MPAGGSTQKRKDAAVTGTGPSGGSSSSDSARTGPCGGSSVSAACGADAAVVKTADSAIATTNAIGPGRRFSSRRYTHDAFPVFANIEKGLLNFLCNVGAPRARKQ